MLRYVTGENLGDVDWGQVIQDLAMTLFFHKYLLSAWGRYNSKHWQYLPQVRHTSVCPHGSYSLEASALGLYSRGNDYFEDFSSSQAGFGEVRWKKNSQNRYLNYFFLHPHCGLAKKCEHWEICSVL